LEANLGSHWAPSGIHCTTSQRPLDDVPEDIGCRHRGHGCHWTAVPCTMVANRFGIL
jgi:hypothetical protein